jgi:hypothetical protein
MLRISPFYAFGLWFISRRLCLHMGLTSGEATGGGGLNPPLASRITPGIRTKPQRYFFGKGVGYPIILLQPTWNRDSLTRSKEVSSKSSSNTTDSELFSSFCGASCLFFSSFFGRMALKIEMVWIFTKVYRRQCTDFCLENALKPTCIYNLKILPGAEPPDPSGRGYTPPVPSPLTPPTLKPLASPLGLTKLMSWTWKRYCYFCQ